ncbi:bacteriophage P2 tail protein GPU [Cupriavidus taiwanensis]|uniref:phage tail protein n=1 Tax=Cupriavidus taiwanensis TaxID=164546 RepID=UPI000E174457|nr:phage tail protein [Cupriavidus taiwanensis]SOZ15571.1 bacteriophage P2 tail protein GPU [Cupriavidus taiwanensis]SOZ27819.1 bacteriophage P2 tail protein GPU [Cupriavidus taiwanensis]SOZ46140.1 bacteriophage P2 tail protein GPU [Cupriavidus taiwanensis]SPA14263.1 bacteriophage P2 tail protein GPU [Cupriavidus taiwanensis]
MMMALGQFVFSLDTAPYLDFQQQIGWRHPANSRTGRRPARQFLGPDDETITLAGVLAPELTGGDDSIEDLRKLGDSGEAHVLIEGTGRYYGLFVVETMQVTRTYFFQDGKARRIEFTLKLTRVDDEAEALIGSGLAEDAE